MEFRYRAGDRRAPSSSSSSTTNDYYFSSASFPYLAQRSFQAGIDAGSLIYDPTNIARERLLGERLLEKIRIERMREQLLAREIARKRMIEEDILREMDALKHFPVDRVEEDGYTYDHILEHRFERSASDNRIIKNDHGDVGNFRGFDPRVESDEVVPRIHSSRREPIISLDMKLPANKLCGSKRKPSSNLPLPTKKERVCSLCSVTATSKKALYRHIKGKKHQGKKAQISKISDSCADSSLEEDCEHTTDKETSISFMEKGVSVMHRANGKALKRKERHECSKETGWWCGLCGVECNSEAMLQSHLAGKKHKACLEISNGNKQ